MPSRAAISLIGLRVAACAISISERTASTCRCSHLGGQFAGAALSGSLAQLELDSRCDSPRCAASSNPLVYVGGSTEGPIGARMLPINFFKMVRLRDSKRLHNNLFRKRL